MRIVGGKAKGRRLDLPSRYRLRPTSCRLRESLFSILPSVEGKSFLDLYAGSGMIGIEALSRGAAKVVFVEKSKILANVIKKNLSEIKLGNRHEILAAEARRGIRVLGKKEIKFDFLFADPPYEKGFVGETMRCISEESLLSEDGIVIIQHSIREELGQCPPNRFTLTDQRKYGDTILSFMKFKLQEG